MPDFPKALTVQRFTAATTETFKQSLKAADENGNGRLSRADIEDMSWVARDSFDIVARDLPKANGISIKGAVAAFERYAENTARKVDQSGDGDGTLAPTEVRKNMPRELYGEYFDELKADQEAWEFWHGEPAFDAHREVIDHREWVDPFDWM